jgi:ATP-dependent protease ClpP protease subunit
VDPQQLIREPDLRAHTEEKKEINDQLIRILAKNTGKSEEEIRIRIKKNPVMSAEEAIEFGIADEIFTDMNIFISSDSPNEENP